MATPVFRDKAGIELTPGDLIVYGHALGRCAGLQYGKVLTVQWSMDSGWRDEPVAHLRVQGVDADSPRTPRLCRPGTLQFEGRVLKVRRDQVPASVLNLLDNAEVTT